METTQSEGGRCASTRTAWCLVLLCAGIALFVLWWTSDPPSPPSRKFADDESCSTGAGYYSSPNKASIPKQGAGEGQSNFDRKSEGLLQPSVPRVPSPPLVASKLSMTALDSAFDMSDAGREYLEAYQPKGLSSVMPAGWKSGKSGVDGEADDSETGPFAEFSRYSITPQAVERSEKLRSVLRLSENTRQGQGRTLGFQSLLRNLVTPIGPQPIGDKAMLWNDSSTRQGFIADSIGKFPDVANC